MKKIVNTVFDIAMSIMLTVTGVLFALSCYQIYTSSDNQMFTYQSIGEAFNRIDIVVYITLALIAVGAVLSIAMPREKTKKATKKHIKDQYLTVCARANVELLDDSAKASIIRERKLRKMLFFANIAIIALSSVLPLIFLLDPASFPAKNGEYNAEILNAFIVYLCMLVPVLAYEIVYSIIIRHSYSREIELLKAAPKGVVKAQENKKEKPTALAARLACFAIAVVFIILGIVNGGMGDVLIKAVNICAECIGLG